MRFSTGALATDGSCRTARIVRIMGWTSAVRSERTRNLRPGQYCHVKTSNITLTADVMRSSRTILTTWCSQRGAYRAAQRVCQVRQLVGFDAEVVGRSCPKYWRPGMPRLAAPVPSRATRLADSLTRSDVPF